VILIFIDIFGGSERQYAALPSDLVSCLV
jgi:hypothetical protein